MGGGSTSTICKALLISLAAACLLTVCHATAHEEHGEDGAHHHPKHHTRQAWEDHPNAQTASSSLAQQGYATIDVKSLEGFKIHVTTRKPISSHASEFVDDPSDFGEVDVRLYRDEAVSDLRSMGPLAIPDFLGTQIEPGLWEIVVADCQVPKDAVWFLSVRSLPDEGLIPGYWKRFLPIDDEDDDAAQSNPIIPSPTSLVKLSKNITASFSFMSVATVTTLDNEPVYFHVEYAKCPTLRSPLAYLSHPVSNEDDTWLRVENPSGKALKVEITPAKCVNSQLAYDLCGLAYPTLVANGNLTATTNFSFPWPMGLQSNLSARNYLCTVIFPQCSNSSTPLYQCFDQCFETTKHVNILPEFEDTKTYTTESSAICASAHIDHCLDWDDGKKEMLPPLGLIVVASTTLIFIIILHCIQRTAHRGASRGTFSLVFGTFQVGVIVTLLSLGVEENSTRYSGQDVMNMSLMLLFGLGYLLTFLRKYSYGAAMNPFLISAVCIQWHLIVQEVVTTDSLSTTNIVVSMDTILAAQFAAVAVVISLGALAGRLSVVQCVLLAILETLIYQINVIVADEVFEIVDVGKTISVHLFAATFGISASWTLLKTNETGEYTMALSMQKRRGGAPLPSKNEQFRARASYQANMLSYAGTIFLWVLFPAMNSIFADETTRQRSFVNTLLSLVGSTFSAYLTSITMRRSRRIDPGDLQNGSIAGAIVIGASCTVISNPGLALLSGSVGGIIAVVGTVHIVPWLHKIGIQDTRGVSVVHGFGGILGSIVSLIVMCYSSTYSDDVESHLRDQALGILGSFACGVFGGALVGVIIRLISPMPSHPFDDAEDWDVPDDFNPLGMSLGDEYEHGQSSGQRTSLSSSKPKSAKTKAHVDDLVATNNDIEAPAESSNQVLATRAKVTARREQRQARREARGHKF